MGLFQKALETYDTMERFAGIYEEGKAEPLAPIAHIVAKAQIEITITADGKLVDIKKMENERNIIIPATEQSAGRTSTTVAPYPLCEQIKYLLNSNPKYYDEYVKEMKKWVESAYGHPKVKAVLKYIEGGTLISDLKLLKTCKDDAVVCWRVVGLGENSGPVWNDLTLMKSFADYYLETRKNATQVCMVTGEKCSITRMHNRGVLPSSAKAKLISSQNEVNYFGRFLESEDANSIGYVASQKAHNALRWLIATQSVTQRERKSNSRDKYQGGRAFICWNPHGLVVPQPMLPLGYQIENEASISDWKDYRADLQKRLQGYRTQENWNENEDVVLAAFDAASDGRIAVTYYNELAYSDFLERLVNWEESCCWTDSRFGIQSPLLYKIVRCAFGTLRQEKVNPKQKKETVQRQNNETEEITDKNNVIEYFEVDSQFADQQMQCLLVCRIDQAKFPMYIMRAIVTKLNCMQLYKQKREEMLFTACAVIRKYHIDHFKEEFQLALEPERNDRSYQWGRMLAIMEKIERDTYSKEEEREPNAIRMQAIFVQRPAYAFELVLTKLKTAYYPQLQPGQRVNYDRLIGEVMEQLSQHMNEYGNPLTETYLLGYYLQKNALYTKKNVEETEEE